MERHTAWIFLSPFLVGLLAFVALPLAATLGLAFTEYDVLSPPRLVGVANFEEILGSSAFWSSWAITITFAGTSIVYTVGLALIIALVLHRARVLAPFWKTLYFLPAVIAGAGESLMLQYIWSRQGMVNAVLGMVGVDGPSWINDAHTALPALILSRYWTIGPSILIFLAARAAVRRDVLEVATLDGAGAWQLFRFIILPLMTPAVLFNIVLGLVAGLQSFTQVWLLTKGGPIGATRVMGVYIYDEAFTFLRMGYAAAVSWILFLVTVSLSVLVLWSARRWTYYEAGARGGL